MRLLFSRSTIGEMAEWSNVAVSKSVVPQGTGGSNPSLSAIRLQSDCKMVVIEAFIIREKRCKTGSYNAFSLLGFTLNPHRSSETRYHGTTRLRWALNSNLDYELTNLSHPNKRGMRIFRPHDSELTREKLDRSEACISIKRIVLRL